MKKPWIKPVVLAAVFLVAVVFFGIFTNKTNEDLTVSMADATLPVIQFTYEDTTVNELHGYTTEMDVTSMRGNILPLDDTRQMQMSVLTYGTEVTGISYELRSMDGEHLYADSEITDYETSGDNLETTITVQNLLEEAEEYMMIFNLETESGEVYYYTRIMQTEDYHVSDCLAFAKTFHDYTFSEAADAFIPTYMDAATGDATTLHYVDLSCTLKQITWADFDPEVYGEVRTSLEEVNSSYVALLFDYQVTHTTDDGVVEYYNVEEYFRLRYTSDRMYVLNFERTMNQIFDGEADFIYDSTDIQLGIRDTDVEYLATEAGDIVAFVQEGELWSYNVGSGEIQRIFSFRDLEGSDSRNDWAEHDIKIAKIDEAGSVDFILYGYMNRGEREGQVGISICHYDGISHTVEEEIFIPYDKSYEMLKAEMGQLMYENELGSLYFIMENTIYCLNIQTQEITEVVSDLTTDCYTVSASNRYVAWVTPGEENCATVLYLMDLSDGSVREIQPKTGDYLKPLLFINEDFLYGEAYVDYVIVDAAGQTNYWMSVVNFMDTSEDSDTLLKSIQPEGQYIGSVSVEDDVIVLALYAMAEDGSMTYVEDDNIRNRDATVIETIGLQTTVTSTKETQVQIALTSSTSASKIRMITSSMILVDNPTEIAIPMELKEERYYVYEKGTILFATDSIADAIEVAYDNSGVVINTSQAYIWMKAKATTKTAFKNIAPNDEDTGASTIVQCISAMLEYKGCGMNVEAQVESGSTPKEILTSTLQDSVVLDLTGCSVEEVLYYISNGNPVFAMISSEDAVLLIGYTSSTLSYYNPATGSTETMSLTDAATTFYQAGNIFFSYLD